MCKRMLHFILNTYYFCSGPIIIWTLKLAEFNCIRNEITNQMASANSAPILSSKQNPLCLIFYNIMQRHSHVGKPTVSIQNYTLVATLEILNV